MKKIDESSGGIASPKNMFLGMTPREAQLIVGWLNDRANEE